MTAKLGKQGRDLNRKKVYKGSSNIKRNEAGATLLWLGVQLGQRQLAETL